VPGAAVTLTALHATSVARSAADVTASHLALSAAYEIAAFSLHVATSSFSL
jgi:hypothetical protein